MIHILKVEEVDPTEDCKTNVSVLTPTTKFPLNPVLVVLRPLILIISEFTRECGKVAKPTNTLFDESGTNSTLKIFVL